MKKAYGGEYNNIYPYCYFHPEEIVVGVCALCLKERLLELALKQTHNLNILPKDSSGRRASRRKHSFTLLPNVFALSSFLRVDITRRQHQRPEDNCSSDHGSIASLEDSFISIKFENNGEASWESKKKVQEEESINAETTSKGREEKSLVEHVKLRGPPLRWRKRIGQLLQLSRWKNKSSKTGHVGLVGGKVEGRRGWMRSLTTRRRRTTD